MQSLLYLSRSIGGYLSIDRFFLFDYFLIHAHTLIPAVIAVILSKLNSIALNTKLSFEFVDYTFSLALTFMQ